QHDERILAVRFAIVSREQFGPCRTVFELPVSAIGLRMVAAGFRPQTSRNASARMNYSRSGLCIAAKRARPCPLWVKSRQNIITEPFPPCQRKPPPTPHAFPGFAQSVLAGCC